MTVAAINIDISLFLVNVCVKSNDSLSKCNNYRQLVYAMFVCH